MSIPSHKSLEKLLDFTSLRQKVISQNIANAETKDYKRREVEFKEILDNRMQSVKDPQKISTEFNVRIDEESPVLSDGNNVDINKEMSEMAKNTIMFQFASKKLHGYYQTLQGVIRGGK